MNTEAADREAARPLSRRVAQRGIRFALVFFGVLAVIIIVFRPGSVGPEQTLAWLSPAQFTSATRPGAFTRLKYKVMNVTGPLWRHFQRAKQQILIEANFVEVSAAAAWEPGLGTPVATNSDGTLAWIISPSELTAFRKLLRDTPEAKPVGGPRITTGDGMQGGIFQGNAVPGLGRSGLGVNVTATIISPGIRLLVKAESTELDESVQGTVVSLKTNVAAACRVLLPNGGGLVLLGANPKERSVTNHWIILSAATVNTRGQRVTPRGVIRRNK